MSRRSKHKHIPSMTYSDLEGAESDLPYLSDNFPAPPSRTDTELNLAVLRRHNPQILDIHHIAPYAVVYTFLPQASAWDKTGCEGSAFLVSLLPNAAYATRYAILVLNRRGLENFELELHSNDEVEITDEYIILQGRGADRAPCVFGLWIFTEPEPASTAHQREELSQKLVAAAEQVEAGRREQPGSAYDTHDGHADGAEMARKGSLTAMLEQQRQQDDAWSVRSHSPAHPLPQAQAPPQPAPVGVPNFAPSADTDFFLSAPRPATSSRASPSPAVSAQGSLNGNGQKETLLDLFRKAGENYRGAAGTVG